MTNSPPKADFALIPGAIAWARRDGGSLSNSSSTKRSSSNLWWPCILYPTWAQAAYESGGLMETCLVNKADKSIRIVGCKKAVALKNVKRNTVPKAAILRPRIPGVKRPGKQNKVVAHYLGLSSSKHADISGTWGAVEMHRLRPYRADMLDIMEACKGKVGQADWKDLLQAIDEASTVLEDETISSKEVLRNVAIDQPQEKVKGVGNNKKPTSQEVARNKSGRKDAKESNKDNDDQDKVSYDQTPEFFDDWKESQSQSQHNTQFSQGIFNFSQPQFGFGNENQKITATTVGTNADGAATASAKLTELMREENKTDDTLENEEKSSKDIQHSSNINEQKSESKNEQTSEKVLSPVQDSAKKSNEPSSEVAPAENSLTDKAKDKDADGIEHGTADALNTKKHPAADPSELDANDTDKPTSLDVESSDDETQGDWSELDTQPTTNVSNSPVPTYRTVPSSKSSSKRPVMKHVDLLDVNSSIGNSTDTPFPSKGISTKVSPSPFPSINVLGPAANEATASDNESVQDALDAKRLFDGNRSLSKKRSIDEMGDSTRIPLSISSENGKSKKAKGEEKDSSSSEDEDGVMSFFTQEAFD